MRLFELEAICENCLARRRRSALKKQQRESEEQEEDAEAAIAEHEEDRSPAAGEENWGASAVYRLSCHVADLPRKHSPVWLKPCSHHYETR